MLCLLRGLLTAINTGKQTFIAPGMLSIGGVWAREGGTAGDTPNPGGRSPALWDKQT